MSALVDDLVRIRVQVYNDPCRVFDVKKRSRYDTLVNFQELVPWLIEGIVNLIKEKVDSNNGPGASATIRYQSIANLYEKIQDFITKDRRIVIGFFNEKHELIRPRGTYFRNENEFVHIEDAYLSEDEIWKHAIESKWVEVMYDNSSDSLSVLLNGGGSAASGSSAITGSSSSSSSVRTVGAVVSGSSGSSGGGSSS